MHQRLNFGVKSLALTCGNRLGWLLMDSLKLLRDEGRKLAT
jgi:hypothetical protein